MNDLAIIMRELGLGSIATGIRFACAKFTGFASDWDDNNPIINTCVLPDGIHVIGWDISNGGYIHATVPRAYANTVETLLEKKGHNSRSTFTCRY